MQFFGREPRGLIVALEHVCHLRDTMERSTDLAKLFLTFRRLDVYAVRSCLEIEFGAVEGNIESLGLARIGTGNDEQVRAVARGQRSSDLLLHRFSRDHPFTTHVSASLWRNL